ncbi:MAG: SDR family oxidoreductase [Solirubrobacterales bacterium]|nr:SDR family oxidoreductase [Solirubrobacterales bacterium]
MDFKRTRALVTGASSGIGEAFARELAGRGADLVLAARSADKLQALAKELGGRCGVSVEVVVVDLSEPRAGTGLAAELSSRGLEIDVLINNAGFGLFGPLHETEPERIAEEVQLNVAALTELTCALLPGMRARDRGAIVNVASTAAFQPVPYMSVYGATKAYVLSFTEALWAETRGTGVRVTALCPGATETAFFEVASEHASIGRRMPADRVVKAAFRALERGRSTVIPGLGNRMLASTPRVATRQTVARLAERTMRPKSRSAGSPRPQRA